MDRRRSCVLAAALLATASAFAPRAAPRCGVAVSESPLDRLGGLLGGKKAAPPPIVEDVAVDDVAPGEMTTAVEGLTPELDGLRKANALFNQGLIGRDEIDEYSRTLGEAQREKARAAAAAAAAEKKRERERREASERVANASLSAASFVKGLAGAVVDAAVVKPAKAVGDKVAYELGASAPSTPPPPRPPPASRGGDDLREILTGREIVTDMLGEGHRARGFGAAAESGKEQVVEADFAAAASEPKGTALAVDEGVRVESEVVLDDGDVFDPGLEDDPGAIFSAVARAGLAAAAKVTGDKAKELTESVVADTKAAARAAAEEKVAEKQFKAAAEKARADELQRQEYKYETAAAKVEREALLAARPPRPRPRGRRRAADRARRPQARARVGPFFSRRAEAALPHPAPQRRRTRAASPDPFPPRRLQSEVAEQLVARTEALKRARDARLPAPAAKPPPVRPAAPLGPLFDRAADDREGAAAASAMARDRLQEASDSLLLEANYLDDDTRAKLAADLAARLVKKTEAAAEEKRREKS
ncbi:hypothetical protein JL722_9213 [Aureococcus anophagefferens]|nr:hypothetical protein JL722_9213 [Aureococcus anophagefferens]